VQQAWKTVLGLLAVVVAPLLAAWQQLAQQRPAVALLIALAWLAIVAAGWLLWRMISEPVAASLDTRGQLLWAVLKRSCSRYGHRYRKWTIRARNTVEARGLGTVGPFVPELASVFIDLAVVSRAPGQVSPALVGGIAPGERRQIWRFLDHDRRTVLAVLGAPGSGKTTLLGHVARTIALYPRGQRRPVPVLLRLRDHAAAVVADPSVTLPALIRATVRDAAGTEPTGWWESRLRTGKCIALLDGLDEVADVDQRRAVAAWVDEQLLAWPSTDVLVTSRPHGYREPLVAATETVEVLPFTPAQVEQFLRGWYRAAERHEASPDGNLAAADARGAAQADHLIDQLAAVPGLHDLTANPLLLTMIANVHRWLDRLPGNRAALYGEMFEVLLWRRDQVKGRPLAVPGPRRLELLARLAYDWMSEGVRDRDRHEVSAWLTGLDPGVDADQFLAETLAAGVLVESRVQVLAFAHQTFQEYLAARHVRDHDLGDVLADAVEDPWWRETALLYGGARRAALRHRGGPVAGLRDR